MSKSWPLTFFGKMINAPLTHHLSRVLRLRGRAVPAVLLYQTEKSHDSSCVISAPTGIPFAFEARRKERPTKTGPKCLRAASSLRYEASVFRVVAVRRLVITQNINHTHDNPHKVFTLSIVKYLQNEALGFQSPVT